MTIKAYRNRCASGLRCQRREILRDCHQNWQVFTMSKGNTKVQNTTRTISTESILITVESNWIQMRLRVKPEQT
jgi:hypothetical protein